LEYHTPEVQEINFFSSQITQLQVFCYCNRRHTKTHSINTVKRQSTNKISANPFSGKGQASRIYKECLQFNNKKPTTQLQNEQWTWRNVSPKNGRQAQERASVSLVKREAQIAPIEINHHSCQGQV
jgi:hypothetical protein